MRSLWPRLLGLSFAAGGGYALWTWSDLARTWPPAVRSELRKAMRSEKEQKWQQAEIAYKRRVACFRERVKDADLFLCRRAYDLARAAHPPLGLLHTTGIAAIATSNLLDHLHAPQRALPLLLSSLSDLDSKPTSLSDEEVHRRIVILSKLGEVYERLGDDHQKEEETALTRAVSPTT